MSLNLGRTKNLEEQMQEDLNDEVNLLDGDIVDDFDGISGFLQVLVENAEQVLPIVVCVHSR